MINPVFPDSTVSILGFIAIVAKLVFADCILGGLKTKFVAKLSSIRLLLFELSKTFSTGIQNVSEVSMYSASGAGYELSLMKAK